MSTDAFEQEMASLRAEYRRDLPATLVEAQSLWRELATGCARPERLIDLQRELHSIAGSAKTFGLPQVTERAREAEEFLEPFRAAGIMPGAAEQARFERLLDALQRSAL